MDHGSMDHSAMGHGDMGHGDMPMPMCSMNVSTSLRRSLVSCMATRVAPTRASIPGATKPHPNFIPPIPLDTDDEGSRKKG